MFGRCTRSGAGTSSPLATASGSSTRISWDNVASVCLKERLAHLDPGLPGFSPLFRLCTLYLHSTHPQQNEGPFHPTMNPLHGLWCNLHRTALRVHGASAPRALPVATAVNVIVPLAPSLL